MASMLHSLCWKTDQGSVLFDMNCAVGCRLPFANSGLYMTQVSALSILPLYYHLSLLPYCILPSGYILWGGLLFYCSFFYNTRFTMRQIQRCTLLPFCLTRWSLGFVLLLYLTHKEFLGLYLCNDHLSLQELSQIWGAQFWAVNQRLPR